MFERPTFNIEEQIVTVHLGRAKLEGELVIPEGTQGIVVIPHVTSCIRYNYRHHYFAHLLRQTGLATILINLLTEEEDMLDQRSQHYQLDIRHLATRLVGITDWLTQYPFTQFLKIGYFGINATGGAALLAATERPMTVGAVVSRGGRTDLFARTLAKVQTPTLLIVGGKDYPTLAMNEDALAQIPVADKKLEIIPEATHQFNESGALEEVARLASQWFRCHLKAKRQNNIAAYTQSLQMQL
ncbi:MAG: dienelactone hydrolase family protein [Calothrix sp. C42_A2020_038]|nr:dienelactone hydrolase family protein [Calothrix sp. C42_A2020_038]